MKSVNASTVSPVSGALPTSASSTSTSIGLNGSSNVLHELAAASPSIGLKPLVQSSTPPSPGAAVGMGWGCQRSWQRDFHSSGDSAFRGFTKLAAQVPHSPSEVGWLVPSFPHFLGGCRSADN